MKLSKFLPFICLFIFTVLIFRPFIFGGKLPIPADTIVGLYHPWRDAISTQYPSGVPFRNFLITDPVRQQYPWRELAIDLFKKGQMPKWNPYQLNGAPLLANIQTAAFYPLNLIYLFLPFSLGWSWQIVAQVILGGLFMTFYLRHKGLRPDACAIGLLTWVGSGFFVAWLEWNTLVQVAIWLPLLFLSIDKIASGEKLWSLVLGLALSASFLAGHLPIFFYILLLTTAYIGKRFDLWFLAALALGAVLSAIQWLPMVTLFQEAVRTVPAGDWLKPEWFLPWQNLAQFIAPDYFGNPATLNYFGLWNYGEFIGFIGVVPLIFALISLFRPKPPTRFWMITLVVSLLFALPNFISELPYRLAVPFISSAQPTRLLVLADFSLAMLAAYGWQAYFSGKEKLKIFHPLLLLAVALSALWLIAIKFDWTVSRNNLILPTALAAAAAVLLLIGKKHFLVILALLTLTIFDLARFSTKFEAFSPPEWLYPETKITDFLQKKAKTDVFRVVALDDRIMPPNFATHYKIQMVSGYDSLILRDFAKNFGSGSRITTVPKDLDATAGVLNIRYFLTFTDLDPTQYTLVLQEGQTKLWETKVFVPRAYFTSGDGQVTIKEYSENVILIKTIASSEGQLILSDAFYKEWQAFVDGKSVEIVNAGGRRGIMVPSGVHTVKFSI